MVPLGGSRGFTRFSTTADQHRNGSCSLHGTLKRGAQFGSNACNTTFEDDVFEDMVDNSKQVIVNADPNPKFTFITKGDPMDSSSSSRSRTGFMSNPPRYVSLVRKTSTGHRRPTTSSGSAGFLNDSGIAVSTGDQGYPQHTQRRRNYRKRAKSTGQAQGGHFLHHLGSSGSVDDDVGNSHVRGFDIDSTPTPPPPPPPAQSYLIPGTCTLPRSSPRNHNRWSTVLQQQTWRTLNINGKASFV